MNTGDDPEYDEALAMALKMLRARDRLTTEIRARCLLQGIQEPQICKVLDFLEKKGLTNDHKVAIAYVNAWSAEKGWGPLRLKAELIKKGLDENMAEETASKADFQIGFQKAVNRLRSKSPDEIRRSLYRLGYSEEFIAGLELE